MIVKEAWRSLSNTLLAFWAALILVLLVAAFLFAYPLITAAMGFALPFLFITTVASVAALMNLRWKLWHGRRPFFFAVADIGFLLCLTSVAVYGFASIADNWTTFHYILMGVVALALARSAFIEFEAWLVGIVTAVVIALVFGAYVRFTIAQPAWFFDFTASLLLVIGIAFMFFGSIFAFLESLRGSARERAPAWSKVGFAGGATIAALAVGSSAVLTLSERETVPRAEASRLPILSIEGGRFQPQTLTLPPGETRFVVKNSDLLVHTFTSNQLDVDVVLGPGSSKLVEFVLPPGQFRFTCRVPGQNLGGAINTASP